MHAATKVAINISMKNMKLGSTGKKEKRREKMRQFLKLSLG